MAQATGHDTDLDTTIDALSGSLTAVKPATALDVISGWRRSLSHSDKPELKAISDDLGDLREALSRSSLDGKEIGGILSKLGQQTTACAKSAEGETSGKLTKLGQVLSKAGSALNKNN